METIKTLSIDIETYSDIDLKKCGVYKYAESKAAELLLFGYSINHEEVKVIDVTSGEVIPQYLLEALADDSVTKWAYNASFERVFLSIWLKRNYPSLFKGYGNPEDTTHNYLSPASWRCSMVWGAYLGLPLSLKGIGAVLKLDNQKMNEGSDLIRYFCSPCKPTISNGNRTRNMPQHAPEKWELFKAYNKRDVEVELAIQSRLSSYPVQDFIWEEYHMDQVINDRGIGIDLDFVKAAIALNEKSKNELSKSLQELTSIENPNSVMQLKAWLSSQGLEVESLGKKAIIELIKSAPDNLKDALSLRLSLAKSSVKKYEAMENAACSDGRARGMFQFYGANRTGRWAGRIIQLQNLPQNHMSDLAEARALIKTGDTESVDMLYNDIPSVLSELIRTSFVPRPGYRFYVADFSAIEARVIAYLAGEKWRLEVFKNGSDIYCASASQMFHVPVEKHGVNSHLRQKGKIAELALGYGGSTGALKQMGALKMGLNEEELQLLVNAWRSSNPHIVQFWWDIDDAVKTAIKLRTKTETHGLNFTWKSGMLFITLPSGRKLSYVKPRIGENQYGGESVTYEGVGYTKKWERLESYGPKFVENIVQAISRDILTHAMSTLSDYFICAHVHDELIIECPDSVNIKEICLKMSKPPNWMPSILLRADGYITEFYRKD